METPQSNMLLLTSRHHAAKVVLLLEVTYHLNHNINTMLSIITVWLASPIISVLNLYVCESVCLGTIASRNFKELFWRRSYWVIWTSLCFRRLHFLHRIKFWWCCWDWGGAACLGHFQVEVQLLCAVDVGPLWSVKRGTWKVPYCICRNFFLLRQCFSLRGRVTW